MVTWSIGRMNGYEIYLVFVKWPMKLRGEELRKGLMEMWL
jgi:hypothetical protein